MSPGDERDPFVQALIAMLLCQVNEWQAGAARGGKGGSEQGWEWRPERHHNLLCAKSGTENLLEARGGYWSVQGRAEAGTEMKCPVELSDVNKTCKNDEDGITGPR